MAHEDWDRPDLAAENMAIMVSKGIDERRLYEKVRVMMGNVQDKGIFRPKHFKGEWGEQGTKRFHGPVVVTKGKEYRGAKDDEAIEVVLNSHNVVNNLLDEIEERINRVSRFGGVVFLIPLCMHYDAFEYRERRNAPDQFGTMLDKGPIVYRQEENENYAKYLVDSKFGVIEILTREREFEKNIIENYVAYDFILYGKHGWEDNIKYDEFEKPSSPVEKIVKLTIIQNKLIILTIFVMLFIAATDYIEHVGKVIILLISYVGCEIFALELLGHIARVLP